MKGIIIDDEAKSRSMLKGMCFSYCPGLEIIGTASSVAEGVKLIKAKEPHVVFLDIRMPVNDGFTLFEHFSEPVPFSVIFTTAYEQYALQAIRHFAVDYLLKPIAIDRLIEAVDRVLHKQEMIDRGIRYRKLQSFLKENPIGKIGLPTNEGLTFFHHSEILRCEAQGGYTELFAVNGSKVMVTRTLKYFEEQLQEDGFIRIHKSHLINLAHIRKFLKMKPNMIELRDGTRLEVSPLRKLALLDSLNAE